MIRYVLKGRNGRWKRSRRGEDYTEPDVFPTQVVEPLSAYPIKVKIELFSALKQWNQSLVSIRQIEYLMH